MPNRGCCLSRTYNLNAAGGCRYSWPGTHRRSQLFAEPRCQRSRPSPARPAAATRPRDISGRTPWPSSTDSQRPNPIPPSAPRSPPVPKQDHRPGCPSGWLCPVGCRCRWLPGSAAVVGGGEEGWSRRYLCDCVEFFGGRGRETVEGTPFIWRTIDMSDVSDATPSDRLAENFLPTSAFMSSSCYPGK